MTMVPAPHPDPTTTGAADRDVTEEPIVSITAEPMEATVMDTAAAPARAITFVEPLAGFESETDFQLVPIDESGVLASLRSAHDPELRFVVSPAQVFFSDYATALMPVLAGPVTRALDCDEGRLELYVVLTVAESLLASTANLRAPLVVDADTGRAVQVILDDASLPLHQPLVAAA